MSRVELFRNESAYQTTELAGAIPLNAHALSAGPMPGSSLDSGELQLATTGANSRRLHILFLPSWYPRDSGEIGGSFFREQAIALAGAGINVGVVSVDLRSPRWWQSILKGPRGLMADEDCGVHTVRFHGINWWTRLPRWFARRWLGYGRAAVSRYIEIFGLPDLIHAHSLLYGGVLANRTAKQLGIPYIVTEHSSGFGLGTYRPWQVELGREATDKASARVAVSRSLAQVLKQLLGGSKSWEVIPNTVHNRFFAISAPLTTLRPTKFTFLTLSGLTRNKNVHGLLHAFHKVRQVLPDVMLHVGGDGPERQALEALAFCLGVAQSVIFLGSVRRDDVPAVMAGAHAFVLPSDYETFGVVLIEALAMGLPCIATRCGGPEQILHDEDGVLVPPRDHDALARAMVQLHSHYGKYDKDAIRERCRGRFGEDVIVGRLIETYSRLAGVKCAS